MSRNRASCLTSRCSRRAASAVRPSCGAGARLAAERQDVRQAEGPLKNILAIDGARNCVYNVFQVSDEDYLLLFEEDTDIAFAEDFDGQDDLAPVLERMWFTRISKPPVQGIHGTYFIGMEYKKAYYPTRRDEEARNPDGTLCRRSTE